MAAALAFVAGVLSILSPCVLPLIPVVLATAASEHKFGPLAMASGLALSFATLGLLLAVAGRAYGVDSSSVRSAAAIIMLGLGLILLLPSLQMRLAAASGPVSNWFDSRFGGLSTTGLRGQFAVGVLLGAVWSPCVGPTLGAASLLASQGKDLAQVGFTMTMFGLGAGLPLALLGTISRTSLMRMRNRLLAAGKGGKIALGLLLISVGIAILSGFDKRIETMLVDASPAWLTELTTRY